MRGKEKMMFNLTLTYENDCRAEALEPIMDDIINGMPLFELMEVHDDWYYTDSAIIELAIANGWDIEEAMHCDEIDEALNEVLCFDGPHASIRAALVNEAYDYLVVRGIARY